MSVVFYSAEPGRTRANRMPSRVREAIQAICDAYDVHIYDVLSDSRERRFTRPRQDAYLLLSEMSFGVRSPSLPLIGKWFDRDHTSVLLGIRRAKSRAETEALAA